MNTDNILKIIVYLISLSEALEQIAKTIQSTNALLLKVQKENRDINDEEMIEIRRSRKAAIEAYKKVRDESEI